MYTNRVSISFLATTTTTNTGTSTSTSTMPAQKRKSSSFLKGEDVEEQSEIETMRMHHSSEITKGRSSSNNNNNTNNKLPITSFSRVCLAMLALMAGYCVSLLSREESLVNTNHNNHQKASFLDPSQYQEKHVHISDSSENVLPPGCSYAKFTLDQHKAYDVCVVGAGLSGTVFAEKSAELLDESVLVMDSRPHIGGNCFDFVDPPTGVLRNQYGSHLFHTNLERVWKYITQPKAPLWKPWYHQKYGRINATLYEGMVNGSYYVPIPVNILTVNRLFGLNIQTPQEMQAFLKRVQIPCPAQGGCQNAEQMAKSRVGEALYKAIFETYTIKQWNRSPKELNASVTARIPVRSDFDPRYFADKYQALPSKGYTAWFEAMLKHPNIDVVLNVDFFDHQEHFQSKCSQIIYTGPIDRYFGASGLERLQYRSIQFTEERHFHTPGYILPTPVVNYPGPETPYTRSVEYKHYLHRDSPHSIVVSETTSDEGEPYYPIPNPRNIALYAQYKQMADQLESTGKIMFVGRLANYKYFDMDKAIDNALTLFDQSSWTKQWFVGKGFPKYRQYIHDKMQTYRTQRQQAFQGLSRQEQKAATCTNPVWKGEFGMELRVMLPWAYYKSQHGCLQLSTTGVTGSKYMYWFSDSHTIPWLWNTRNSISHLPPGNPFVSDTVHISDFPLDTEWQAPPFRDFFQPPHIPELFQRKPLVILQNKYTDEWESGPVNFMDWDLLHDLLSYLTPKYTVLYKRFTTKKLKDHQVSLDLGEKSKIRKHFPDVVMYETLQNDLTDPEDQNLLLFGVSSLAKHFLSVQGGTAVVSSYFGGTNTILIQRGKEMKTQEYGYFHRFSNATVVWKQTPQTFYQHVLEIM